MNHLIRLAHHRPTVLAAGVLIPWCAIIWWFTGDYSPLPFLLGESF